MVHSNYNTDHNMISNSIGDFETYTNDYSNVKLQAPKEKDHKHFFGEDYDEEFDIVICNGEQVNNTNADFESTSKEHHIIFINDELDNVYYNGINYSEPLPAPRGKDDFKFFNNKFNLFSMLKKFCYNTFY